MVSKRKNSSVKERESWNAISAISAMVAAIAALVAICQTYNSWKERFELERPYLTYKSLTVDKESDCLKLILMNVGIRKACHTSGDIYIFNKDCNPNIFDESEIANLQDPKSFDYLNRKYIPIREIDFSDSAIIIPNLEYRFNFDKVDINFERNKEPFRWIIIGVTYSDLTSNSKFSNIFYFKWEKGENIQTIKGITTEEEKILKENLNGILKKYL